MLVDVEVMEEGEAWCWMMVLLTANLYAGALDGGDEASEMRDWRMLFYSHTMHASAWLLCQRSSGTDADRSL